MPQDTARYALDILERMSYEARSRNPIFPAMFIKLKMNLGQFEEAQAIAEQYAEDYEAQPETPERNHALATIYAFWGTLRMKMCVYADLYDFDIYFKKMAEYFNKNPFQVIGAYRVLSITARASLVGTNRPEAMEEYFCAMSRAIPYLSQILNGSYEGFDDLARGELRFYRMDFIVAEQYFKQSLGKACEHDQYVTQHQALVCMMHIDIFRGDYVSATAKLRDMEALFSEKDYGIRYTMYDIAYSFYHLALGQPEQIPKWLKSDFCPCAHPSYIENYANRVRALYHYQTHRYNALLTFIENAAEQPAILFDKIEMKVLEALSLYRLNRHSEAIAIFSEAYYLAESNRIIAPFIQQAKDMRTFIAVALRDAACPVPRKWLEDISYKSSALAKRRAKVISEYKKANNLGEENNLTERETKILKDLSRGVSRLEVAAGQNISVNTVKLVTNIIYNKLGANSLADAIRIAVNRKIIY
jgi:LuxR family maltose regulon positive regulatory protein